MKNDDFIITSYYTVGTPYVDVCNKFLAPSVNLLCLLSDIKGVDSRGSWSKNTSYKPEFLKMMMNVHKENIVFVDADAEIKIHPELFSRIPEGYYIAAHILDKNAWYGKEYRQNRYELLSGTLWFRNCDKSRSILETWDDACKATNSWEQRVLQDVLNQMGIEPYALPLSYCYINTLPGEKAPIVKVDDPVIIHHQVSRKLKNAIR
jgi:hypothetical protein